MRPIILLVALFTCWSHLFAQAPQSANLWRVATASLTVPPATQNGPAGLAWNPAAGNDHSGLSAAVHVVHTSDVVGLSSILFGVQKPLGRNFRAGISGGRIDVRDLVRTSSSPTSEGTIPVYTQFLGVVGQYDIHGLALGGHIRLHNARFDLETDNGFTLDFGARYKASSRLVVAAATHFLPVDVSSRETTDYYAGLEYTAFPSLSIGNVGAEVLARYGITYVAADRLEHIFGGGLTVGGFFRLDASVAREAGYESGGWRPAVAVSILAGRYLLGVARSNGLNDLGATYRIGLDAMLIR